MLIAIGLTGCAASHAASGPTVVAHGVMDSFDLVSGRSYHVQEATTDLGDSATIIRAREGTGSLTQSPAQRIEEVYGKDSYRHYGGKDEPSMPPCTVDEQDPVEVDALGAGLLNSGQPTSPVSCTTADGVRLYVTAWSE